VVEYRPNLISADDERRMVDFVEQLDFQQIEMRGQVARRTVRQYGLRYDFGTWNLQETDPLPPELEPARAAAADLAGVEAGEFAQTLVSRYPEGAGIGWHRDAPAFGKIVGISLLAPCRMRFQRGKGEERETFAVELEPRSGYLLAGAVRWAWQHSIPATRSLRYSLTFRTLKAAR
jgi:DNA oxidative demethylase